MSRLSNSGLHVAPQIAPEPEAVDGEEADGADRGDRYRVLARTVADRVREPEQDDDEHREQEQGRRVVRKPRAEAHDPVVRRHRAGDDRQPEHEQRVREQRPEDRRLGDDDLARARGAKRTTKSSGRFPSVDWRTPVSAGPKRAPTASVATPIAHASPASAAAATQEHGHRRRRPRSGGRRRRRRARGFLRATDRVTAGQSPFARTSSRGSARSLRAPCPRRRPASASARPRPRAARCSAPGSARAARPPPRRRRP